ALRQAFGDSAEALADQVARLAERAAAALEAALRRRFVELSLDVGVDQWGRPWIFELNAKPLHFDEPDIQQRRVANLLEYVSAVAARSRVAAAHG
ncbi:MAG: hypothetical protein FWJ61_08105, partial [Limnochordales bacterium]